MTLFSVLGRPVVLALLVLWVSGCTRWGESPGEEEKDPHFLAGKSRFSSMDYDGAVTAFENALTANPKSAAAHLELGFLYEEKKTNYAAAIYHFQRHLELRPTSNVAENVRQHILSCTFQLAKTVPFALVNRQVQEEIRKLNATNSMLRAMVDQLNAEAIDREQVFSNRLTLLTQFPPAAPSPPQIAPEPERRPTPSPAKPDAERRPSVPPARPLSPVASNPLPRPSASPRIHIVKANETLASIARRYQLRPSAIQTANPTLDARKLRVGQIIKIPPAK